jgi:3-oxoacyl-[acyl-carrier protein] reductase
MTALDFSGKSVVVIGGSAGIGHGIAQAFRDAGASVVLTGTREADAYDSDFAGMTYRRLNAADDAAAKAFAASTERCDVLVNALGTVVYGRKEFEIDTFRQVMDVNLNAVMHISTLFRDKLAVAQDESGPIRLGGAIINVGSMASFFATRNNPAYSASKGALVTLTKTLAENWARYGIRVNAIAPGLVATKITKVSWDNPEIYQATVQRTPLRRWGTPEDMAGPALFLASPLSGFVTGQIILIDGGMGLGM